MEAPKNTALSIVGASRANGAREVNDFYPTPPYAVRDLLIRENFDGSIWEPACGNGAISEILKKNYTDVYSTDLIDRGYGDGRIDFLSSNEIKCDNIITNPPFSKALEFVEHAKRSANRKIAFLLKLQFLESTRRYYMFQDKQFPLKCIYVFCKRLTISKDGYNNTKGGMLAYAWYIWDKTHSGQPTIKWIRK